MIRWIHVVEPVRQAVWWGGLKTPEEAKGIAYTNDEDPGSYTDCIRVQVAFNAGQGVVARRSVSRLE